jgi:hypothetical protein
MKGSIAMYNQLRGNVRRYDVPDKTTGFVNSAKWLLVLALLCAIGFAAAHYAPQNFKRTGTSDPPPQPRRNLSEADTEDLLQHMDNALAAQSAAAAEVRKSNAWMDRALSLIDDDSLTARRLDLARSASRAADERIGQARDELQVTRNVLIERSTRREH